MFTREHFGGFEMDSTDEMAAAYFEKMLEYRMSSELPFKGKGGTARYVELLRKYYNYPGFSSYRFYTEFGGRSSFNTWVLQEYLEAVALASVEDGINYLDKAMFYFYDLIDEPHTTEHFLNVQEVMMIYDQVLRAADSACKSKFMGMPNYIYYVSTVSPTLLKLPNMLPIHMEGAKNMLENDSWIRCIYTSGSFNILLGILC